VLFVRVEDILQMNVGAFYDAEYFISLYSCIRQQTCDDDDDDDDRATELVLNFPSSPKAALEVWECSEGCKIPAAIDFGAV